MKGVHPWLEKTISQRKLHDTKLSTVDVTCVTHTSRLQVDSHFFRSSLLEVRDLNPLLSRYIFGPDISSTMSIDTMVYFHLLKSSLHVRVSLRTHIPYLPWSCQNTFILVSQVSDNWAWLWENYDSTHRDSQRERGRKLTSIDVLMSVCVSCLVCSRLENSSSRGFFSLLLRVFVPQERYLSRHRVCLCSYRVSWNTIVGCEGHDQGFVLTTSLTNKTAYKTVCRPVFPSFKADKNNSRVLVL